MTPVMRIAVDKPRTPTERNAIVDLVDKFDELFELYDISPVVWTADEEEAKLAFVAYIPPDCMPEFDEAADKIAELFSAYDT